MAYETLYRRHRPQRFADLVGQDHVAGALSKAVREGKVAHAYLFTGTRGVGKTSAARILAKALNCENDAPGGEPCNACGSCHAVTEGRSLDVFELDAASNNSVENVRDLRDSIGLVAVGGRRKVYIVDEAHMLTVSASNALLKILEEPPPHVVFVLATTEPAKLLETVRSRCTRFDFRSPTVTEISALLGRIAAEEGLELPPAVLDEVARRGRGSLRDALSNLERLTTIDPEDLDEARIAALLGSTDIDLLVRLSDAIADSDTAAALAHVETVCREGRELRAFAADVAGHFRSLFLVRHGGDIRTLVDVSDVDLERLQAQANRFSDTELTRLLALTGALLSDLKGALEPRLLTELAVVRMTRSDLDASPAGMLVRLEALEARLAAGELGVPAAPAERAAPKPAAPAGTAATRPAAARGPTRPQVVPAPAAPPPSPVPAPSGAPVHSEAPRRPAAAASAVPADTVASSAPAPSTEPERVWDTVLRAARERGPRLRAVLEWARLLDSEPDEVRIAVRSAFAHDTLGGDLRGPLRDVLAAAGLTGAVVLVSEEPGPPPTVAPPASDEVELADSRPVAQGQVHDEGVEMVRTLMGAEVVEDRNRHGQG